MKIAFMASDAVAIPAMNALFERGLLACVISNADKPKGRGKKLSPNDAAAWAISKNLPLLRPESTPDETCISWMKSFGVDCIIVMAYGKILRENILNFPSLGCLNLHGSILPHLRGASPIETAIALGDKSTGVSLMKVVKKMDSGDVADTLLTPIADRETGASLRKKIAEDAAKLLVKNLEKIEKNALLFTPQKEAEASYARKLSKADMMLDFGKSAKELDARIRAFGAGLVEWQGGCLKILESYAEGETENKNFAQVNAIKPDYIEIVCGKGVLKATMLQAPCANALKASDFANGCKIMPGLKLKSASNAPLLKAQI